MAFHPIRFTAIGPDGAPWEIHLNTDGGVIDVYRKDLWQGGCLYEKGKGWAAVDPSKNWDAVLASVIDQVRVVEDRIVAPFSGGGSRFPAMEAPIPRPERPYKLPDR
jgi:hypothetical protein